MGELIDRDAAYDAIGFERCNRTCTDCPTKCTWFYTVKNIPAVNRWISCRERLPENRERVLVCFRSGTVHIAVWYGDYDEKGAWKVTSQFPTKLYRTDTIPKWMPMPEPPEVNEP